MHLLQKFHADIPSHRQTLSSVVDDGRTLIDSNDVSADVTAFSQKLDSMETRWQDVVEKAGQKKSVIDSRLELWQDYRQLLDKLSHMLDDVDQSISQNPVTACDTEQAKQLLDLYHVCGHLLLCLNSVNLLFELPAIIIIIIRGTL